VYRRKDFQRINRFPDIMDPKQRYTAVKRGRDACQTACQPLARLPAGEAADY
jgi:hypothetical protein